MPISADDTATAPKPLARPLRKLQVGAGCLVVLLAGAWLAPVRDGDPRSAPPPERAAPLLEERTTARAQDGLAGTIAEAADAGQAFAVHIAAPPPGPSRAHDLDLPRSRPHAGNGVVVADGRVLTHADALAPSRTLEVEGAGGPSAAFVVAFEPATGLVLLAVPPGQPVPPLAVDPLAESALVVGISRIAGRAAGVAALVTPAGDDRFAVGGGTLAPGLPLFDPQGRLVAVAGARGTAEAFAVAPAVARLTASLGDHDAAPLSFGVSFQDRRGTLAEAFGPAGVIVADTITGSPAAGVLEPGTLVLAIDGAAVDTAGAAVAALQHAAARRAPALLTVRRRGERGTRRVSVTPVSALDLWRRARGLAPPEPGIDAGAVFPADVLAAGEVDPAARLLAIEGQAVRSTDDADRALRRRRLPVVAVLRDADGRFVAALEGRR